MADTQVRTLHYGSEKLTISEDHWREVADRYATAARDGGDWIDVVTVSRGAVTIWASPSVSAFFTAARDKAERRAIIV